MFNIILIIVVAVMLVALLIAAFLAGYFYRDIRTSISALRSRVASLEKTDLPEPAIIDPKTPKELKEHQFDEPDGESAIIAAKKPSELRREKDRQLTEELNRMSGQ